MNTLKKLFLVAGTSIMGLTSCKVEPGLTMVYEKDHDGNIVDSFVTHRSKMGMDERCFFMGEIQKGQMTHVTDTAGKDHYIHCNYMAKQLKDEIVHWQGGQFKPTVNPAVKPALN